MVNETEAPRGLPAEAVAFAAQFFEAARTGSSNDRFEEALRAGLPANIQNDKGDTFVMLAAYHGHADLVRTLLAHGADPNKCNDRGQSPLAGAVFKNDRNVVSALLEGGADPDIGTPTARQAVDLFNNQGLRKLFDNRIV